MIVCPICQQENADAADICTSCGAPLAERAATGLQGALSEDAAATDVEKGLGREIGALLTEGRRIQAIKRYREATGCDLLQAKEAIESIEQKLGIRQTAGCAGLLLLILTAFSCVAAAAWLAVEL